MELQRGQSQDSHDAKGLIKTITHNDEEFRFRWICPGTFVMGSPKSENDRGYDEPQHEVTITRGFWLGETPVTQAQYYALTGLSPSYFKGDTRPVDTVSWNECTAAAQKLGARLPTEAEWEYAARGGEDYIFAGSNDLKAAGWTVKDSNGSTHPVGKKAPNGYGLYDMTGNVWEWVWDWYGAYSSGPQVDPQGAAHGSYRGRRGGGWFAPIAHARVACRNRFGPTGRGNSIGFRLAMS
jgi:formylglycine-generating enzyme required for sulfatase activity